MNNMHDDNLSKKLPVVDNAYKDDSNKKLPIINNT